jgi:aminoglycoside phosphotransferase family enzyme/predicted kinase
VADIKGPDGRLCDHLVVMRRLPEDRRLATLVADPGAGRQEVVDIARLLAAFHERAARSSAIDRAGSVAHIEQLWCSSLDQLGSFPPALVDPTDVERARALALRFLHGRHPLFAHRVFERHIVDGHGDLLAQDVFCLDDGPRILDCLEFDPLYRHGDVLLDLAFLAMDLEHLGRPDLAKVLMDAYREHSFENHPRTLEQFYVAYRALVRWKVSCLRAEDGDTDAAADAAAFAAQCLRRLDAAQVHLVLVGGLPGTGKSTVAAGLADALGWTQLRSDEVRKELAGLGHTDAADAPPFRGIYEPSATEDTYQELLRRARVALKLGDSVVLDASWLEPGLRDAAASVAADSMAVLHELRCELPLDVARSRLAARHRSGGDASDATPEVLDALAARFPDPWASAAVIRTDRPPEICVDEAVAAVQSSP